jgi:Ca-activated chloride channel family protein
MLPDLLPGRRVVITGRFAGTPKGDLQVSGFADGQPLLIEVPVHAASVADNAGALPYVWARSKIADLAFRQFSYSEPDAAGEIKRVALDFGLLSPFTAFVAVDSTRITEGSGKATVPVAVPVPEGVKYDSTVSEY